MPDFQNAIYENTLFQCAQCARLPQIQTQQGFSPSTLENSLVCAKLSIREQSIPEMLTQQGFSLSTLETHWKHTRNLSSVQLRHTAHTKAHWKQILVCAPQTQSQQGFIEPQHTEHTRNSILGNGVLKIEHVPELGELLNGEPVTQRQQNTTTGAWRVLIGGNWQPIEIEPSTWQPTTLTPEHVELLATGGNGPEREFAITIWATTPQTQREAVVRQCSPEVIQALKQTVLYG